MKVSPEDDSFLSKSLLEYTLYKVYSIFYINDLNNVHSDIIINSTAGYLETINPNVDCVGMLGNAYIVKMGTIAFLRMYFSLTLEIPAGVPLNAPVIYSFRPKSDLNNIPIDIVNVSGIGVVDWKSDGTIYSSQPMGVAQYKIDIPYYTN